MSQRVSDDFVPTLLYFDTNIFCLFLVTEELDLVTNASVDIKTLGQHVKVAR
jgi:hypothetical protein